MTASIQHNKQWVLLPVEVKMRAFESKILLACFVAEAGYGALLGRRTFSGKWQSLPRGACVCKGLCPNSADTLMRRKAAGFQNVYLDEEGLVYPNQATYVRTRTSKELLDCSSRFLAWGADQAEAVTGRYPESAEKVCITGNPRVDLWRREFREVYRETADELRSRFGPYILISSNFAECINANGENFPIEQARKLGVITTSEEEAVWRARIDYRGKLFHAFTEAIPQLAETFPKTVFVIRPHPGDDQRRWLSVAEKRSNIVVAFEGTISPWILGAESVLHSSCTSGVEAYVMGRVAIAYIPHTDERFDMPLPNALSVCARDIASLKTLLGRAIAGEAIPLPPGAGEMAVRHLSALEGDFAGERIVKALATLDWQASRLDYARQVPSLSMKLARKLKGARSRASALLRPAKRDVLETTSTYRSQKFSGSDLEEVRTFVRRLRDVSGRFVDVNVRELDRDIYCFTKGS